MRITSTAAALAAFVLSSTAVASDLKLNGQTSHAATLGSTLQVDITGNPGLPCLFGVNTSAGPSTFAGESLPIALGGGLIRLAVAGTDGAGVSSTTFPVPTDPAFLGLTLFSLGAILDPADPNGIDFSNGATLTFSLGGPEQAELAGNSLPIRPFFEKVRAINLRSTVEVSIDPLAMPALAGQTADLYVVASQDVAGWTSSPGLVDVSSGGAETVTFTASGVQANTFVVDTGTLAGPLGTDLGAGYDIVIDLDQNGQLSAGDVIDGYGDNPGVTIVRDTTKPGPYAVTEAKYTFGSWKLQDTYYPTNVASLGKLPLVVISHGNGHNYQWYDHIGFHLASHGYVVMSHSNETGPGIQTASATTLDNTDVFLGNLANLPVIGNALDGHIDVSSITWLGHSRGAEGVARAYDKIVDGTYVPINFSQSDIKLVSSIAPTDFLGVNSANPHGVNYHLWVGQSDSDVSGCASSNIVQSFHLHDRAENQRQSISLMGVGHGWFHDGGGNPWATGPCLVGEADTHLIIKGYILPLVKYHIEDDYAARDFLTRQYESFHPFSAPITNPCVEVDLQFRDSIESGKFVIDDFQTNTALNLASSGASVSSDTIKYTEGRMDDSNSNFTALGTDTWNGFTMASASDTSRGAVFNANGSGTGDFHLTYNILDADKDWTSFENLSFRACQVTRNGWTIAALEDAEFEIELVDTNGNSSVISILATGAGVVEPYQRSSCGSGTGWGNEFETFRLALEGFTADDPNFDLANVNFLRFRFGPSHGSPVGRYGLDDIELTK
ncbi:MAG: hypothetical protein P8N31_02700 [Planctomycetota bacterium]|nr:hypothetical protein [Planctomycetota bacterium]MDG2142439.1 hypothetical protein [Planctomycetota bacterium]